MYWVLMLQMWLLLMGEFISVFDSGNFQLAQTILSDNSIDQISDIVLGNLKGDGSSILDIIASDSENDLLSIFSYDGSVLKFSYSIALDPGAFPVAIGLFDFTGDSVLEILVANKGTQEIVILDSELRLEIASKSFEFSNTVPTDILAKDITGNGSPEILVTDENSDNLHIYSYADNNIEFLLDIPLGVDPKTIDVGNFDSDKELEILTANEGSNNLYLTDLLLNQQTEIIGYSNEIIELFGSAKDAKIANINSDGHPDIFGVTPDVVQGFLNPGDGNFSSVTPENIFVINSNAFAFDLGDFM